MGASGAASEKGSCRYPIENWRFEGLPKSSLETMGVLYTVFVLPEATAMDFNPDGRVLSELVELLCRLKWGRELEGSRVNVGDDAGGIVSVPIHGQARADAFDRLIAKRRGFSFRLTEVADDVFWRC